MRLCGSTRLVRALKSKKELVVKTYLVELEEDEVLVALKRGEGYDDVHPELVSEDAVGERWPQYRTIHGGDLKPFKLARKTAVASVKR